MRSIWVKIILEGLLPERLGTTAGPAWASKIVGNGKCAVMREKNGYYVHKQTEIDDAGNRRLGIKIVGNGYPSEKQAVDAMAQEPSCAQRWAVGFCAAT